LAKNLDSNAQLIFHGALKNAEVAKRMQQCDAFIFFTRYETFGCVMAEALCCGKPLIASRIPVLEENLQEFVNAIFVRPEDENDLVAKLIYFTQNRDKFDMDEIAEKAAEKYNYALIGNEIFQWYREQLTGMR
jgi:glycosyltransferase involved in cell wall biosynthesis